MVQQEKFFSLDIDQFQQLIIVFTNTYEMNFTTKRESYVTGSRKRCCQTSSQAVDRSLAGSLTCCGNISSGSLRPCRMYGFHI